VYTYPSHTVVSISESRRDGSPRKTRDYPWQITRGLATSAARRLPRLAVESRLEEEPAQAADQIFGPGFRPKEANVPLRRAPAEEVFTWPLAPTLGVFAIDVPSRRAYSRCS